MGPIFTKAPVIIRYKYTITDLQSDSAGGMEHTEINHQNRPGQHHTKYRALTIIINYNIININNDKNYRVANMKNNIIDLILHPVRMRILMALAGHERTPQQLSERLPDIPQATLYRHIKRLAKANIIIVVDQYPVRGATEKVYALEESMSQVSVDEINKLDKTQHMRLFIAFIASLLSDYNAYLENQADIDLVADGVGYRKVNLYLSDAELSEMSRALNQAVSPFLKYTKKTQRRERIFSTILIPVVEAVKQNGKNLE